MDGMVREGFSEEMAFKLKGRSQPCPKKKEKDRFKKYGCFHRGPLSLIS